ncbi:hypothetical protein MKW98_005884 [Papaver atlanticum]|uniref:Uncharacterized protein n=1 Tax=Papaver atlanticum TaxID=357466 RepID=A0AAD4TAP9_9MAGN|nr:hypothetical protein MKW98_005884 [Papaver atlanticum]
MLLYLLRSSYSLCMFIFVMFGFRDGTVSQFNQVLNVELNQIIEACEFLGKDP